MRRGSPYAPSYETEELRKDLYVMKRSVLGFMTGVISCLMVWAMVQHHQVLAGEEDRSRSGAPGGLAGVVCQGDLNGDGQVGVFDLLLLLDNWGSCAKEPAASCEGFCGGQAPDGCWCDQACVANGDCCEDACEACDIGCPPDPDSCEGHCDDQAPGGCYCDDACQDFGDCCEDVCDACDIGCPLDPDSCEGNCDEQAPGGCYCDADCVGFGDCCDDFADFCG